MDKKPSIAYLIADAQICGGVAVVCQHANRLARRGFDACIVSTAGDRGIDWFPGQSVPVYPLAEIPDGIDIGVATWWETTHALYRLDVPRKFYFVQSDETRFYPPGGYQLPFARDSYRFDFELITEARWIAEWLAREFGREARYVPNGLDLDLFHPDEPLAPKGEKPRVLIEGPADMPSKGVAESFRALRGIDCETWYVNYRGEPAPSWKPDRYFYRVPMEEMRRVYSSCDIMLKLSSVEGSSGPPLEMMACGGACVVSRVTGLEEAIVPGENALVVGPGDTEGASAAVRRLIADRDLRERLIAKGRETAERLDWERSIDLIEKVFLSPAPAGAGETKERLADAVREKEAVLIEGYARMKKVDEDFQRARSELMTALDRRNRELALKDDELNRTIDELNDIRNSKQWKIAGAVREARRSPRALLALPFRIVRIISGTMPEGPSVKEQGQKESAHEV